MVLRNYCVECGSRIHLGEDTCSSCGAETGLKKYDNPAIFTPPLYDVGFFNFDIDFSPFIKRQGVNFNYKLCSCGFLNETSNKHCFNCGENLKKSKFDKLRIKRKAKKKIKTIRCECGALNDEGSYYCYNCGRNLSSGSPYSNSVIKCKCGAINSSENLYCEICGMRLSDDERIVEEDLKSNFNLKYRDSVFCFCGEENRMGDAYCNSCGAPLLNMGTASRRVQILCVCSTLNSSNDMFCINCGKELNREQQSLICICGTKNPLNVKVCQKCGRPLNPHRIIKSKIVCTCGAILDYNSDYCLNCGKSIKLNRNVDKVSNFIKDIFK